MGYLIDTNVWSELQKGKRANAGVRRWYASVEPEALHVSVDSLLAATALEHDLVLVTRNVRDVEPIGASLLNPFEPNP